MDPANVTYSSLAGVLFNKSQTTLLEYPLDKVGSSYTIPSNVTNIADGAFGYCSSLTGVTIPNTVTSIGYAAFDSSGLTRLTIPDSVTSIGSFAFYYCQNLTNATLGNSLTNLGQSAFASCVRLTRIAIPASLPSISSQAFQSCARLSSVSLPNSITNIGSYAFSGCTSLTNITLPGNLLALSSQAFASCTNLAGVFFKGNAPSADSTTFSGDNAILYYLPGATGWTATLAGLPTVLWNPLIQTTNALFGVRSNKFSFLVTGTTNIPIVVEACTNLGNPLWVPLQRGALSNGSFYFGDASWTNFRTRFYHISSP